MNTPEDALHCLIGTETEFLAVGNCILRKEDHDLSLASDSKISTKLINV